MYLKNKNPARTEESDVHQLPHPLPWSSGASCLHWRSLRCFWVDFQQDLNLRSVRAMWTWPPKASWGEQHHTVTPSLHSLFTSRRRDDMQTRGARNVWGAGGVKSRLAGLPGWTINLCLFQSCSDWNCVKLEQGCHQFLLASLSFSSSPGDAQRLHAMDRFCQRPSLHTVLAWRRSRRRKKKKERWRRRSY